MTDVVFHCRKDDGERNEDDDVECLADVGYVAELEGQRTDGVCSYCAGVENVWFEFVVDCWDEGHVAQPCQEDWEA